MTPRDTTGSLPWPPGDGEMARRVREHDWSATPLGPVEGWPERLKAAVEQTLACGYPAMLAWGTELIQVYNDPLRPISGARHPDILGQPLRTAWPEAWAAYRSVYTRALAGETVTVEDMRMVLVRGGVPEEAWFTGSFSPVRDEAGAVAGVMVTAFETTDRVRAARALCETGDRQAFLLKLSDTLRPLADPAEVTEAATRLIGQELGTSRAYYAEWPSGASHGEIARDWAAPGRASLAGRYPIAAFRSAYDQVSQGRTWIVEDNAIAPGISDALRSYHRTVGVIAWVDVPLVKEGEIRSVLCVVDDEPRRWTDTEVALIEDTAERCWAAVERARAEDRLREGESRFRALVTAGTYMTYRMSPDWSEMLELRGQGMLSDTGEPASAWADSYILPEDEPLVAAAVAEAIRTKSLFEMEHRVRKADGGVGWVLSRAVPILGEDGEIREWFGAGSDVTARREAEERLRRIEGSYRTDLESQVRERTAELRSSRDLLQATMDSSTDMIQVFEAVRDERGEIVDFRWVLNNHTSERSYGKVGGQRLLERNPGVVTEGIFDAYRRVTETGVPEQAERHYVHEQFDGWFYQSVVRLNDGVATTTKDITDWKRSQAEILLLTEEIAQARLRESEKQLRGFGEASSDLLWIRDAETLDWTYLSPAFESIYGLSREEALHGDTMRNWLALVVPEDRERARGEIGKARAGERVTFEYRITRPSDGQVRLLRNTDFPIRDATGRIARIGGLGHDATEESTIRRALEDSERRLRTLTEGIPQLVWRAREHGLWTWVSPQWTAFTGQAAEDSHGWGWLEAIHPDDREDARAAWERSRPTGVFEAEYRIREAATGEYRWFQTRATPVRDRHGAINEWLGTSTDVQDLREMQGRLKVLVAELQHRTRNLLGVVRGVTDKTLAGSASLDDFQGRIRDRLGALARVNGLLSRLSEGDRITFDELIRSELRGHGVIDGHDQGLQVDLSGPKGIRLRSSTVQTLALGLHELATNALKYGALSRPEGRLEVSWSLMPGPEGTRRLRVEWRESGVPVAVPDAAAGDAPEGTPPLRRGYGRELIEKALPYQLRAETDYRIMPEGVRCTITLPLSSTMGEGGSSRRT